MATWGWGLEICLMYADSFVFEQKIYCSFLQMDGVVHRRWGWQNWSFTVAVINIWPKNVLKLQPIQSLEAVASSTSSRKPDKFYQHREQPSAPHPLTPLPTPLVTKHLLFSLSIFCVKKMFWPIEYSFLAGYQQTPLKKEV